MMQVSGNITYNGRHFSEFQPLRTASYVEQVDTRLIPEMTVRETLDYSARCQGPGLKKGKPGPQAHNSSWALFSAEGMKASF